LIDENEVERPEEENARLVKFSVDACTDCVIQWFFQQIYQNYFVIFNFRVELNALKGCFFFFFGI
jgi:hypothetical protein